MVLYTTYHRLWQQQKKHWVCCSTSHNERYSCDWYNVNFGSYTFDYNTIELITSNFNQNCIIECNNDYIIVWNAIATKNIIDYIDSYIRVLCIVAMWWFHVLWFRFKLCCNFMYCWINCCCVWFHVMLDFMYICKKLAIVMGLIHTIRSPSCHDMLLIVCYLMYKLIVIVLKFWQESDLHV